MSATQRFSLCPRPPPALFKNRINWKFGIVELAFYGSDILHAAQLSQYPTVSVKVTGSRVSRINVSVRVYPC